MLQQTVLVTNTVGIHSRPAALLVDTAARFGSSITVSHGERTASTQSMVKLLSLRIKKDTEIMVSADGPDEKEAMAAVIGLIESKFGEE